jgi:hypothetical protein
MIQELKSKEKKLFKRMNLNVPCTSGCVFITIIIIINMDVRVILCVSQLISQVLKLTIMQAFNNFKTYKSQIDNFS